MDADFLKCTMCNCIYIKHKRLCNEDQGHHHFEIQIVKLDKIPRHYHPYWKCAWFQKSDHFLLGYRAQTQLSIDQIKGATVQLNLSAKWTHLVRVHQPGVWEMKGGDEQTNTFAFYPLPV